MDRRSRSVGEVALRSQLGAAQQKIGNLEVFIRDRERHFQVDYDSAKQQNNDCLHAPRIDSTETSSSCTYLLLFYVLLL